MSEALPAKIEILQSGLVDNRCKKKGALAETRAIAREPAKAPLNTSWQMEQEDRGSDS